MEYHEIKTSNKINGWNITKVFFDKLHSWIYNHPWVVKPPLKNDHVNIKYHTTGEVIKIQKLLIK